MLTRKSLALVLIILLLAMLLASASHFHFSECPGNCLIHGGEETEIELYQTFIQEEKETCPLCLLKYLFFSMDFFAVNSFSEIAFLPEKFLLVFLARILFTSLSRYPVRAPPSSF